MSPCRTTTATWCTGGINGDETGCEGRRHFPGVKTPVCTHETHRRGLGLAEIRAGGFRRGQTGVSTPVHLPGASGHLAGRGPGRHGDPAARDLRDRAAVPDRVHFDPVRPE